MSQQFEVREVLSIANPNKAWVVKELDKLNKEWSDWLEVAHSLPDSPEYDANTCSEAIKDGRANLQKHEILREKTLVFLGNNFTGYAFLFKNWPNDPHESKRVAC